MKVNIENKIEGDFYNVHELDILTYNVLDLFAGIGGASYAGKLIGNWRTVCYVEWDDYCQRVIQQRIKDGIFDDAPIWGNICTFDGKPWAGSVDIITAGFPCQPFSVAGQRRGEDDERNMWPETLRVIDEIRPRFAFLENVPGLITSGYFGRIIGDLTEIGYDCRWTIVSAADVGAPHLRKRLWVLAHNRGCGLPRQGSRRNEMLDKKAIYQEANGLVAAFQGEALPYVCRRHDGLANGGDRIKALGNAWVPLVAATAWNILTEGLMKQIKENYSNDK